MSQRAPDNRLANGFLGSIDEVAVYNRALAAGEIQGIYLANGSGKCVVPVAPFVTGQPANQTVSIGGTAAFNVAVPAPALVSAPLPRLIASATMIPSPASVSAKFALVTAFPEATSNVKVPD